MSKLSAFFLSFFVTMSTLILAGCATNQSEANKASLLSLPEVVEIASPPGHILLEQDKVELYRVHHKYTLRCGNSLYGATGFNEGVFGTHIDLLGGQTILVDGLCVAVKARPESSIYIYDRREPPR